jgi:hypothetical protein
MKSLARSQAARRRAAAAAAIASVGAGILGTQSAEAGIVIIDLSTAGADGASITGLNAGLSPGNERGLTINAANGNSAAFFLQNFRGNNRYDTIGSELTANGLVAYGGFSHSGRYPRTATPTAFAGGSLIDGSVFSTSSGAQKQGAAFRSFYDIEYVSPDIRNKYLGFRTNTAGTGNDPNYGWINVNWDSTLKEFEILGADYESVAGVAIQTPSSAPVPEIDPSGLASAMSLVMGSAAMLEQRRRKRAAVAAESATVTA